MGCRLLGLTLLSLLVGCFGQQCTLITPNVLRLENEETIVIDGHNKAFEAEIEISEFLRKSFPLVKQKVSVNNGNKFLGTAKVKIPSKGLTKDPNEKQYVYVIVKSPVCNVEKVVLLGYESGYILIQADKTLYTPGSTVYYRLFSMDYKMSPINKAMVVEFLTPDNIIVQKETVKPTGDTGIFSLSYSLPELVSLGSWTISARYEDSPRQNYSTNFEVKEYVLPTIEIQLIPHQKYFYVEDLVYAVDIKANYLYGKPVNGKAFVIFGVRKDDVKTSLPNTLIRISIENGEGHVMLKREDLVKNFRNADEILEYSLYMSVTLITDSGSEIVEGELVDIPIVRSPFKILFTKTSKYFKPGMTFGLTVFVTNPDGSPAAQVPVVADAGNVKGITGDEGTARLTLNTAANMNALQITVRTSHPTLPAAQQATASMTANAYQSGGNYLHISINAAEVKPGDNLGVQFNFLNANPNVQRQIQHFTYLIISKGRILTADRQPREQGQTAVTKSLLITEEFIPSFRIVAYYVVGNEFVSDSVWVDVTDTCMGTLLVTGDTDSDNRVQTPGSSMNLKLRADYKANVGLVAVDKGVFVLNSKYKISQKKVWDSVEKSDIGCTPGSGANSMGVFYDAGLALQSNIQATQQRTDPLCPVRSARRRRSSAQLIEVKATYASKYKDPLRRCCNDGMLDNPMGHSCERRAENIFDGKECVAAFLDCCKYIKEKKEAEKDAKETDEEGRSDEDSDYIPDADIFTRTQFPESTFWKVVNMTEAPDRTGISSKVLKFDTQDSITSWEVLAVSLSENKGICVAKPYEVRVMKDFFIDLKLPYSVVRNEQVEIRAVLYNYGSETIKVRVELSYNPEFCSYSTSKAKYKEIVNIKARSSVAVPFIIVPLTLGQHAVEVKAAVSGQFVSDGIMKKLKVVPEGVRLTKNIKSVILDPQGKGTGGVQEEIVYPLDATNIVPQTKVKTIVTIQGSPISQLLESAVDGSRLNSYIIVPYGCGEQNMMTITPSVIACIYLDATNQWERIGVDRRSQALNNIIKGYVQQLVFRKSDNSYSAFTHRPASTWLTAYVVKVFTMAHPLVDIQSNVLCGAAKWLILNRQNSDGRFREDAPVYHTEMMGGIKGSSEDVALTAFVLIALKQSEKICSPYVTDMKTSIDKAATFLLGRYQALQRPYTVAITSYALAMAGALNNPDRLLSASKDKLHWDEPDSRVVTIEATSYALLALMRLKQNERAGPVVRWISEQRFFETVYGSTQANIVMFQALTEYQMDTPTSKELNLDVSLKFRGKTDVTSYRINTENALLARSAETDLNTEFVVKATGKGQGTLTVTSVYYALETEKEKTCRNFELSLTVQEEKDVKAPEGALSTRSLEICARHLKGYDAGMSIIDVSMMTGFIPDVESLNKLMKGVDKYISKFEINKDAADKGTLVIYLDKISYKRADCVKFNVHQIFKVGLIQPASVTVYEYYAPESRCTKFYHVDKDSNLLGMICLNDICRCAEENCFLKNQLEGGIDAEWRFTRACEPGVDYVYKAQLEQIQKNDNYDTYVMKIIRVIKSGTDIDSLNKKRSFVSHVKCRKTLDLKEGRDYLIWGVAGDLWEQPSGFSYLIGRHTWIEWWPKDTDCKIRENRRLCLDFDEFSENLELMGCFS